ncbi:hypothetical protein DVH02_23220 [Streptomyces corynorhini]|uniref:Low molecular weight protein antigen 6 PH domain-containing protein n=1 Tax=Streptomyces corynorhini TaxID=2282652 RepID=A0A370B2M6_9ACTN|nr:hypothetical protein DVH02_23220 [Streptomyces corynorhini]
MKPRVLRRPSIRYATLTACCAGCVALPVFWFSSRSYDSPGDLLMVCSVLLALCWLVFRIGRARVEIHDGGLLLVGTLGRDWIPWGAYLMVDTEGGLTVRARGERSYAVAAFGGSLIEEMLAARGRSGTVRAAEAIRAASRDMSAEARRDREVVSRRWEVIPADLLLLQVVVALALTLSGTVPG